MPRQFKNWKHVDHTTNSWELYQTVKLYTGLYGKENVKVIENSYIGHWYADVYLKKGAKKKRELSARFGSAMTFKDKKGRLYGDRITVRKVRRDGVRQRYHKKSYASECGVTKRIPSTIVKKLQTGKLNKTDYMFLKFGNRKIVKEYYDGNDLMVVLE